MLINLVPEAGKAQFARGGDIWQALQLIDHGLWDHPAMDPNSCGVAVTLAPVGPWPQSEYSSSVPFPHAPYCYLSGVSSVALVHCIGTNPDEQERLRILGELNAQNIRVGQQYYLSCGCNTLLFTGVTGVPWWTQEYAPREWHPGAYDRSLVPHGRTGCVTYSLKPPPVLPADVTASCP